MKAREQPVSHLSADRYEASRTLVSRFTKDTPILDDAWQWTLWFLFNGQQCGTRCPYRPTDCFIGSDTCTECPAFEAVQIVTRHSGRVYCKKKKAELTPLPEVYFIPEGRNRLDLPSELPTELCPW